MWRVIRPVRTLGRCGTPAADQMRLQRASCGGTTDKATRVSEGTGAGGGHRELTREQLARLDPKRKTNAPSASYLYWRSQTMTELIVSPFAVVPLSVKVIVFPSFEMTLCLVILAPSSNFRTTSAV